MSDDTNYTAVIGYLESRMDTLYSNIIARDRKLAAAKDEADIWRGKCQRLEWEINQLLRESSEEIE